MRQSSVMLSALGVFGVLGAASLHCSSTTSGFGGATDMDAGLGRDASAPADDGSAPSFGEAGDAATLCVNLQCQKAHCDPGAKTTVSGTVYDPAGKNPLYNVIVYVPNAPVEPFKPGISCDKCGTLTTGAPVVTTLTASDGTFVLEDVPVGQNIPLVMQIGKWRRQIVIPEVGKCVDTKLTDQEQTRLPKNHSEGDIPRIAITTGGCDAFECLLRNIGIEDSEFTDPTGSGRIHLYQGVGGAALGGAPVKGTALWSNATKLHDYDVMINSCECGEQAPDKPAASLQNVADYATEGGRMFATHYHYYWIKDGPTASGFPQTASWLASEASGSTSMTANVNMTFAKGKAFAEWLLTTGASTTLGKLPVTSARYDATAASAPSVEWLTGSNAGARALMHYTFNTPVGVPEDQQCGKILFSDFHVIEGSIGTSLQFPAECAALTTMTPQQKALEFMLFDLSSCIQRDTDPPKPPAPR
jgi:hypothetical protein